MFCSNCWLESKGANEKPFPKKEIEARKGKRKQEGNKRESYQVKKHKADSERECVCVCVRVRECVRGAKRGKQSLPPT